MLIGVLGTIVGFYFGNAADGPRSLQVASPLFSGSPVVDKPIELSSFIAGGKPPFTIEVAFTPADAIKLGEKALAIPRRHDQIPGPEIHETRDGFLPAQGAG